MKAARRWRAVRSSRGMMPGDVHHPDEGVVITDPACQRFGRGYGRCPGSLAQQRDFPDDHPGRHLLDDHDIVVADVPDLAGTG